MTLTLYEILILVIPRDNASPAEPIASLNKGFGEVPPSLLRQLRAMPDALYFEDFPPGEVVEYGGLDVSADDIVAFAREFDPQPFHIDEEAARDDGRPHRLGLAHVRAAPADEL